MSRNGEHLTPKLRAMMLSELQMPEVQDYPRPACLPEPDLTGREDRDDSRTTSYENRTSEPNSEIAAVIKAMKETGCAHEEIKEVVAILANKHQPSYENRTSLVRESDAELKLRRKKEYDRKYQKQRYQPRARDAELKNLVRDENRDTLIVSKVETLEGSKKVSKRDSGIRARESYPDDFEKFWRAYPRTPNMGKAETFAEWKKTPAVERQLATEAAPKYAAWLKTQKPDYSVLHAVRFLRKKRFDGFSQPNGVDPKSEEYQRALEEARRVAKGT